MQIIYNALLILSTDHTTYNINVSHIYIIVLQAMYSSHMVYLATHLCFLPNQETVIS